MSIDEQETSPPPSTSNAIPTEESDGTTPIHLYTKTYTPRKSSRLSLSRIKREKRERERSSLKNIAASGGSTVPLQRDDGGIVQDKIHDRNRSRLRPEYSVEYGDQNDDINVATESSTSKSAERSFHHDCSTKLEDLHSPSENGIEEEINFDLGEMDDSSSSDGSNGSEHDIDNSFQGHNHNCDAITGGNESWGNNLNHRVRKRQSVYLDDDEDDESFTQSRVPFVSSKRRITILEDDGENADNYSSTSTSNENFQDSHNLENRQIYSDNRYSSPLLSPRRDGSVLLSPSRTTNDYGIACSPSCGNNSQIFGNYTSINQTTDNLLSSNGLECTTKSLDYDSAKKAKTLSSSHITKEGTNTVRKGLRTSPFPRHSFSRVFHSPVDTQNEDSIESSDSDSDEDGRCADSDDDLEILPKKKKAAEKQKECEVICLDSDGDEQKKQNEDEDFQRAIRASLLPEWGSTIKSRPRSDSKSVSSSHTRNLRSTRKRSRTISSNIVAPKSSNKLSTTARNTLRRVSNNDSIFSAPRSESSRRDLTGGSGLGLGGFQLRTQHKAWNDGNEIENENENDDDDDNDNTGLCLPLSTRRKTSSSRAGSSRSKSASRNRASASNATATRVKIRRTYKKKPSTKRGRRSGRGRKRNYRKRGNVSNTSGNVWSANERGISSSRGHNGSYSGKPYMNVGQIDPNLGTAGGVSISYE